MYGNCCRVWKKRGRTHLTVRQSPLTLGDIDAETLDKLAAVVEQHGERMLRATQSWNLVFAFGARTRIDDPSDRRSGDEALSRHPRSARPPQNPPSPRYSGERVGVRGEFSSVGAPRPSWSLGLASGPPWRASRGIPRRKSGERERERCNSLRRRRHQPSKLADADGVADELDGAVTQAEYRTAGMERKASAVPPSRSKDGERASPRNPRRWCSSRRTDRGKPSRRSWSRPR